MKIESTFDPKTNRVEIRYDLEMQELLLAASRAIAKHFEAKTYANFSQDLGQNQEYEVANGGRLLLEMIRSKALVIETDAERIHGALTFLCICALRILKYEQATAPLIPVLTVFANISPFPVISVPLPPASEALDRRHTPPETWKTYQGLRTSPKSETAFLTVAQGYELLLELEKNPSPRSSLKDFSVFVNASCLLYRTTLEALAAASKTSQAPEKVRK